MGGDNDNRNRGKGGNNRGGKGDGGNNRNRGKGGNDRKRNGNKTSKTETHPYPFDQISEWKKDNEFCPISSSDFADCALCAESQPAHAILVSCGHSLCYKCCCRIRFLGQDSGKKDAENREKSKECPICKTESDKVFMTPRPKFFSSDGSNWNEQTQSILKRRSYDDWGLSYDTECPVCPVATTDMNGAGISPKQIKTYMQGLVDDLFFYKCWICDSPEFRTVWDLQKHVEHFHSKVFCKCCFTNRDIFISEQMCYGSKEEVELHHKIGDKGLVPIKPHAKCEFCNKVCYTHDQLFEHMRKEHQWCQLCYESHKTNVFFKDGVSLYNHYLSEHHVCRHENCMKHGIFSGEVVFPSLNHLEHHRRVFHNDHTGRGSGGERLILEEWTTHAHNPDPPIHPDGSVPQNEKTISFNHIKNPQKAPDGVVLPKNNKKKENNPYPDNNYGIGWQDFKPKKGRGKKGEKENKDKKGDKDNKTDANGHGEANGSNGTEEATTEGAITEVLKEDNENDDTESVALSNTGGTAQTGGPKDSDDPDDDDDSAPLQKIFHDRRLYEKEERTRMENALPEHLLLLPASTRWDSSINKASFLHAVDAVLELLVGDSFSCKNKLLTDSLRDTEGSMANVNLTKVKRHIAQVSPLQLDSLSEMRGCLLELLDSRFDTDPITGLRPLFFRTLRKEVPERDREGQKTLDVEWLAWKYQAFNAVHKLRDREKELIRIYVGMALEKATTGYGGLDRAKQFPSLGAAAMVKEGEEENFNPAELSGTGPNPAPSAGWGNASPRSNNVSDFPSLGGGGGRSPRGVTGASGGYGSSNNLVNAGQNQWAKKVTGGASLQAQEFPTLGGGGSSSSSGVGAGAAAGVWASGSSGASSMTTGIPIKTKNKAKAKAKSAATGSISPRGIQSVQEDIFLVDEDRPGGNDGSGAGGVTMAERLRIMDEQKRAMASIQKQKDDKKKKQDFSLGGEAFPGLQPLGGGGANGKSNSGTGKKNTVTKASVFGNSSSSSTAASSAATSSNNIIGASSSSPSNANLDFSENLQALPSKRQGQAPQRYNAKQEAASKVTLNAAPNAGNTDVGSSTGTGTSALHALRQQKADKETAEKAKRELLKTGYSNKNKSGGASEASIAGASAKKALRTDVEGNYPVLMASKKGGVLVPSTALGGLNTAKKKPPTGSGGVGAKDAWDEDSDDGFPAYNPAQFGSSPAKTNAPTSFGGPSFLDKLKEAKKDTGPGAASSSSSKAPESTQSWGSAAEKKKQNELKKIEGQALKNEELFPSLGGGPERASSSSGPSGTSGRGGGMNPNAGKTAAQIQEEEDARLAAELQKEMNEGTGGGAGGKKKGRQKKTLLAWG